MESHPNRVVRFGVFEADLDARELRKHGLRIKLQDQPFQLLALLLERPGEIVSREELQKAIWPEGTFIEFDHGLNGAVQKIRAALGDDASNPCFVETVPRRGYRFIVPVESPAPPSRTRSWHIVFESRERRLSSVAALLMSTLFLVWRFTLPPSEPASIVLKPKHLTTLPGAERAPSFSPDGSQVAFEREGPDKNIDIYVQAIGAGEPLRLTNSPYPDGAPAWSPDGRRIAFIRELGGKRVICVVSPQGTGERKVAEISGSRLKYEQIAWTPDSQSLVFSDQLSTNSPKAIYQISLNSGERSQLTTPPEVLDSFQSKGDRHPAFSPDGRFLAFLRREIGARDDLYLAPVEGGPPRLLPFCAGTRPTFAWAADSQAILCSFGGELRLGSIDGATPIPIHGPGPGVEQVAVARKSGRIAWNELQSDSNIWRLELDPNTRPIGDSLRVVASTRSERDVQISPEGSRILYTTDQSGSKEIWSRDAEGGHAVRITGFGATGGTVGSPRWSPDGERIAFDGYQELMSSQDIWVVPAGGGPPLNLTSTPNVYEARPAWSADGRLVYYRTNLEFEGRSGFQIWKIPSGGGDPVMLTADGGIDLLESPDGRYVYYARRNNELWRVAVSGGAPELVLRTESQLNRHWAFGPRGIFYLNRWSPEGVRLEHWSFASRNFETVANLSPTKDFSNVGIALSASADGRWIVYSHTDRADDDLYYAEGFQ